MSCSSENIKILIYFKWEGYLTFHAIKQAAPRRKSTKKTDHLGLAIVTLCNRGTTPNSAIKLELIVSLLLA